MLAGIGPRLISINCVVNGLMSSSTQLFLKPIPVKKALLIDADDATRTFLANVLDPSEWSIRHAADNQTALELAARIHFDLILTGEKPPGKAHTDLCR